MRPCRPYDCSVPSDGNSSPHGPDSAYGAAGVDYETLDAGKRDALSQALASSTATADVLAAAGARVIDSSRGEPAFAFEVGDRVFAFVLECLGTKSIIARELEDQLGAAAFANVAYDTVTAIVNDLCCLGAFPLVVNAYFAVGSSDWYERGERKAGLLEGWREACIDAGASWGGGESPSLSGLVAASEIELAGSAVGAVPAGRRAILGDELASGDEIVIVASSGLHANGASLARRVAAELQNGYRTELPSGRSLGEALLDRSAMYVGLVRELLHSGAEIHYLSHITGHGLLKLMRPRREFTYRLRALPEVPEVLGFLVEESELAPAAAYSTFNMGCGFAVYCSRGTGEAVVAAAGDMGMPALVAGRVEDGPRRVVLEELGVVFEGSELDLAPSQGR
jgi:phosphoribosylformylglycinamidine cyclo-ligase